MLKGLSKVAGFAGYVIQYGCWTHVTFEYAGDLVCCSGPSMEPTLYSNNVLLTEKISPRRGHLDRGDIIVARNPTNPRQFICKRVIAMPGDTVVMHSAISVNPFGPSGQSANSTATATTGSGSPAAQLQAAASALATTDDSRQQAAAATWAATLEEDDERLQLDRDSMRQRLFRSNVVVVPRGHVWLEGDNAANSQDSRQYGPVPLGLVRSRAIGRVWPPAEWCVF